MLMSNINILTSALGEWGYKVAQSFLPEVRIPADSAVGKFMYGILGVDPSQYNPWNELGFLAEPVIQTIISPLVAKYLSGIPDEQVEEIANKFVDSFLQRAKDKGSVNLFGIELKEDAFEGLKEIINNKFKSNERRNETKV